MGRVVSWLLDLERHWGREARGDEQPLTVGRPDHRPRNGHQLRRQSDGAAVSERHGSRLIREVESVRWRRYATYSY